MKLATTIAGCLLAGAVAVLSAPTTLAATLTMTTDKAAWDALVSNVTLIDFDHAYPSDGYTPPAANGYYMVPAYSLTIGGITFTDFDSSPDQFFMNNYNVAGSGTVLKTQPSTRPLSWITIAMPAGGVTAWGVDLVVGGAYATYTINIGPNPYTSGSGTGALKFFGFTSDTPITSVDINYGASTAALDNFVFGSVKTTGDTTPPPTETPEAATMLLCATGLWSMSRFFRRATSHV